MTSLRLFVAIAMAVFIGSCSYAEESSGRPNVVLIVTDDQGYGDLSCHGNPVLKTPHIDQLFSESVRLTDFHVAPTCSPTRASLMTGRHKLRTGVWHTVQGRNMMRANEMTMANILGDAGYRTGFFGKWHLGDNYPLRPEDRGFEHVVCHRGGGVGQTPDYWDNAYFDDNYFVNSKPQKFEGYCTDIWFNEAKSFIAEDKPAPFFAYIATNAPHGPYHSPVESAQRYLDQNIVVANFFGMIANADDNVGALRSFLREKDLSDNTIFIFMTDNGTAGGHSVFNAQMRGRKGSAYEGGHRVPCFIHWPAGNLTKAVDVDCLTSVTDLLPTLMELCGIESKSDLKFDGLSLATLLSDPQETDDTWKQRVVMTDSQRVVTPQKWRNSCVMSDKWRLINGKELYDLRSDPGQKNNIAVDHPLQLKRLADYYETFWAEVSVTFDQDVRIALGHERENPTQLTCHDWISASSPPWNQSFIRAADKIQTMNGYWNVDVVEAGTYRIELCRWPQSTESVLRAAIDPGAAVPGTKAYRQTPGRAISIIKSRLSIGDQVLEQKISDGDTSAAFEVELSVGPTTLHGEFQQSEKIWFGSFYASVEKKN